MKQFVVRLAISTPAVSMSAVYRNVSGGDADEAAANAVNLAERETGKVGWVLDGPVEEEAGIREDADSDTRSKERPESAYVDTPENRAFDRELARVVWLGEKPSSKTLVLEGGYAEDDKDYPGRYSLTARGLARWNAIPADVRIELGREVDAR